MRFLRTFRGQTLFAVVAIHAAVIPVFFMGLIFFVKTALSEHFVNQIRTESHLYATLIPGDAKAEALDELFYAAAISGPLLYAELMTLEGSPTWRFASPYADAESPPFREDFFFGQHDDGVYFIANTVRDVNGEPRAQLRLGFDEHPAREQIAAVQWRGAWLTLGYFGIVLILAAFWVHRLYRPLRQLGMASRRVATGEFRKPIVVQTRLTEIQSLAADIDHMRLELLKKTDSMAHLAMHDALTGLPNRALLTDRTLNAINKAERSGTPLTLLVMDIDRFKEINDTLGHAVGDELLRIIPGRLLPCLRASDTLARLGGDEFGFLFPDTDAAAAAVIIERIVEAMRGAFRIQGQVLHMGLSIGVAHYPEHGSRFDELLRKADIAMYGAKRGRLDCFTYKPEIDSHSRDRLQLAAELRRDIDEHRLEVHYQPQIRIADGAVVAMEALVRWPHRDRGEIHPDDFLPMADRLGLMVQLGGYVVRRALGDYAAHPALHGMRLCINMAANNLHDPELPALLSGALAQWDIDAADVTLEITEREYMTDPAGALQQLHALREIGFGLAIDDFGKGHSSFEYLKRLPATEIKIDKTFVADMATDRHDFSLVAAIIALGRQLGLAVVAEGVENQRTLDMLRRLGCERVQGFLLARPMPIDQLVSFVGSGHAAGGQPVDPAGRAAAAP